MVILHIASITNSPYTGVSVVVPQYIIAQSKIARIGFINVNNETIERIPNQFRYEKNFDLKYLPSPFDVPDLVVFQETYRKEYLYVAQYLIKQNIPYITVPHGELGREAQRKKRLKKELANILFFNRFVKNAIAIQCLSDWEKENTLFDNKKIVLPNGVNVPSKMKRQVDAKQICFTYIGRLDMYHKGIDLMIEAVAYNAQILRKSNCVFNIYGPDYKKRVQKIKKYIKKKNVQDLFFIHSEVSGKEKENVILDSDIFIQTSRFEGMPVGILEAMGYAIPCLVTQGTTLGEKIIQAGAGWMAETNAQSIGEKILDAINEKNNWQQKGRAAREYIEENYEWDKISKITIKKYMELIKM